MICKYYKLIMSLIIDLVFKACFSFDRASRSTTRCKRKSPKSKTSSTKPSSKPKESPSHLLASFRPPTSAKATKAQRPNLLGKCFTIWKKDISLPNTQSIPTNPILNSYISPKINAFSAGSRPTKKMKKDYKYSPSPQSYIMAYNAIWKHVEMSRISSVVL